MQADPVYPKGFKPRCLCWQRGRMGLEEELEQFHGTQEYYRNFTGLLFTEGIKYLAERAGCYWLVDLVGSYQHQLQNTRFQLWEIQVRDDSSALVTMAEDTGEPIRVSQDIEYTDFPLEKFSFYCVDNVMMLKSEY